MADTLIPAATRDAQAKASNPHGSAWVSANAGSGKTFVLARRVLRLLLDGQDPSSLLCLTFTKAAAAEMATRVFDALADWTRLDDDGLRAVLADLQGEHAHLTQSDVSQARSLFAQALETPGGLRIQTIHAFCESLLHQFPFEANVAASFSVLDDRDADDLMGRARADVITQAVKGQDHALSKALANLLDRMGDQTLYDHLDGILKARHALLACFNQANIEGYDARLAHLTSLHGEMLGLGADDANQADALLADPMASSPHLPKAYVDSLADVAPKPSASDLKNLALMQDAHRSGLDAANTADARRAAWQNLLYTSTGAPRALGRFMPQIAKHQEDVLIRVEREQTRGLNLKAQAFYTDLMRVALAVLDAFDRLKARRGALDFDDLIARTALLLNRSEAQAWVRYKIDQRIDHILVDEAQDTSAQQWSIIRALADDFFDGQAVREGITPTFFAVGDDKQSIYSFQGADPRQFDGTRRALETKAMGSNSAFEARLSLLLSFRSTRDVLSAVDTVFAQNKALQGVTRDTGLVHEAHRQGRGLVELWPLIKGSSSPEPEDWTAPVDALPAPHIRLADAIGARVRRLVDAGQSPGDVLILLRTRGAMADAINRSLKQRGVAVAGTDRLLLTDHIAVEDLMALMQVVLLPEDDLSLAVLLTSPLIGLSDEKLEALCTQRTGLLIDALNAPTDDPVIHQAAADIRHWRAIADYASPFTFLHTVLGAGGGRKKMMARLGEECRDPLDEVLRLARTEETRPGSGLASLEAFLDTLRRIKLDIKRDMETRSDKVRIMTVHGAKGLEARTVFLVDTCRVPRTPTGVLDVDQVAGESGGEKPPLIVMKGDSHAPAYKAIQAERKERQLEEYRRLLYVAMTRARDQLIITGHMTQDKDPPDGCWYYLIDSALGPDARDVGPLEGFDEEQTVRVWRARPFGEDAAWQRQGSPQTHREVSKPDCDSLRADLARPTEPAHQLVPLRPSQARQDMHQTRDQWQDRQTQQHHEQTARTLTDAGDPNKALTFGTLVHYLLEVGIDLHGGDGIALAKRTQPTADETMVKRALSHAQAVHAMPEASFLFGPNARGEVPLRGTLCDAHGVERSVNGTIDRLVIEPERVVIVDFKTNAHPPHANQLFEQVPDYCAQMGVYHALLTKLFPNRQVQCGLLWTAEPRLDWLDEALMRAAIVPLTLAKA